MTPSNSPSEFSFDLYPGLDDELNAAYARNLAGGSAEPDAVAAAGLGAVVNQAIANQDPLAQANLEPQFQTAVQAARTATDELLLAGGYLLPGVPELNDPAFEQIDWNKLSTAYTAMETAGMQPEVIVSRQGMSPEVWKRIYGSLPGTKNGGLYIDENVAACWTGLNSSIDDNTTWSISVLPATPEPTLKNVPHNMAKGDLYTSLDKQVASELDLISINHASELYPDISTYLTLQALRLKNDQPPIDASTWTWLNGEFTTTDGTRGAPYARWDPGDGQVSVYWLDPGNRNGDRGVRPAVRG